MNFTIHCYAKNIDYVNDILSSCVKLCDKQPTSNFDNECQERIVNFLTIPLKSISLSILKMVDYPKLMKYLPYALRKRVSSRIAESIIENQISLNHLGISIQQLLSFVEPILKPEGIPSEINYEFKYDQELIAKLIQMIDFKNPEEGHNILKEFRNVYINCDDLRTKLVLPSIINAQLRLLKYSAEKKGDDLAEIIKGTETFIKKIVSLSMHELGIKLYLSLILSINEFDNEKIVYYNNSSSMK